MDVQKARTKIVAEANRRKLSTADLARKSRINYLTVQTFLTGTRKPQKKTIMRLAKTLKVDLNGESSETLIPKQQSVPQYDKAVEGDLTEGQIAFIMHSLELSRRGH